MTLLTVSCPPAIGKALTRPVKCAMLGGMMTIKQGRPTLKDKKPDRVLELEKAYRMPIAEALAYLHMRYGSWANVADNIKLPRSTLMLWSKAYGVHVPWYQRLLRVLRITR